MATSSVKKRGACDQAALKEATRRKAVTHWTKKSIVTPALVERVFGDGRKIILLSPINFRPERFVVRVDSQCNLDGDDFCGLVDDVVSAIEDEYVEFPWARKFGFRYSEDPTTDCNSRIDLYDGGWCWSEFTL